MKQAKQVRFFRGLEDKNNSILLVKRERGKLRLEA